MARLIVPIMLVLAAVGCGSDAASPPETKANEAKPNLTPEQQQYVDQNRGKAFSNPKKK